jgi:hypothetical protein
MYISRSIPEDVLGRVRGGARDALLEPLAALRTLAEHDPGRARHPYTGGLLEQIERLVCLLDAIGWRAGASVSETAIDINQDGPALCEALSEAMRVAVVQIKETRPSSHLRVRRSALRLSAFAAVVEAACLERVTGDPAVFIFQADLESLLSEMERHKSGRTDHPTSRSSCRPPRGAASRTISRSNTIVP